MKLSRCDCLLIQASHETEALDVSSEPRHTGVVAEVDRQPAPGRHGIRSRCIGIILAVTVVGTDGILVIRIVGIVPKKLVCVLDVEL